MHTPSRIGRYDIEARLGAGGMAEVFVAVVRGAEGFARRVALKRILPRFSERADFTAWFTAEARDAASLHHANIVSVFDFQRDPQHGLFLVMELMHCDLAKLLRTGAISTSLAIYIATEMLRGLGHVHRATPNTSGLVHRDVSPSNVLLSSDGMVKLADFGLVKPAIATTRTLRGKPAYMSPEQANGEPLDGRSDLFSVGVVLWEMLVGRPLFRRDTPQEAFASLFFSVIEPPSAVSPDVSEDVSGVVMRLLQSDREQRYATAEEAIAALATCADAPLDGRLELATLLEQRLLQRSNIERPAAEEEQAPDVSRRFRPETTKGFLLAMGVAAVVAATASVAAVMLLAEEREPAEQAAPPPASAQDERPSAPIAEAPVATAPAPAPPPDPAPPDKRPAKRATSKHPGSTNHGIPRVRFGSSAP